MKSVLTLLLLVCFFGTAVGQDDKNEPQPLPDYDQPDEGFAVFKDIDPIRGQTADDPPSMFMVQIALGYPVGEQELIEELIKKYEQIYNTILVCLSSKTKAGLAVGDLIVLEQELLPVINKLLTKGRVRVVLFREFHVF